MVWAYTDADGLCQLFSRLGEYSRPWTGLEIWESIEGDFRLSAACSSLGSVTFSVEMAGLQGAPEEWRVSASLVTEMGRMQELSAGAHRFFGGA